MIYLDYNASTPVDPAVASAMLDALRGLPGNPSSSHADGIRAKAAIDAARASTAALLGVSPGEIFFTSGGTESNNLAIFGIAMQYRNGHVITSAIEHPSVLNPCRELSRRGFAVTAVGVGKDGAVRTEDIRRAIRRDTVLITVMHANNETGVLQPLPEIAGLARRHGIIFHTDAAQSVGKVPVSAGDLDADLITVVSHKFYGPKGVGALYIRKGVRVQPVLFGAGHEGGLRPGTENVPAIVGLGKACDLARVSLEGWMSHTGRLAGLLLALLKRRVPGLRLNGQDAPRLPNTLNVSMPGADAIDLIERIGSRVAVSAGSACHAGERRPSPVLRAMGIPDAAALSSLRISLGKDTTEEEVRAAVEIIVRALRDREP